MRSSLEDSISLFEIMGLSLPESRNKYHNGKGNQGKCDRERHDAKRNTLFDFQLAIRFCLHSGINRFGNDDGLRFAAVSPNRYCGKAFDRTK